MYNFKLAYTKKELDWFKLKYWMCGLLSALASVGVFWGIFLWLSTLGSGYAKLHLMCRSLGY